MASRGVGDAVALRVRARLVAARRAAGLEPELLDAVCGLREGTVARLEAGLSRIAPVHLFRLAAVFDVDVDWFFADDARLPSLAPLPTDHPAAPSVEEARRFLAAFARLADGPVRAEIRELVGALGRSRLPGRQQRLTSEGR
ncbi:MAG TPA: helix-turn-helix transcriptional regulator [Rhodospirillales bacterium]|nr:helix-turn-helix transcriptional regulator [Rhodospirillales bacterium]